MVQAKRYHAPSRTLTVLTLLRLYSSRTMRSAPLYSSLCHNLNPILDTKWTPRFGCLSFLLRLCSVYSSASYHMSCLEDFHNPKGFIHLRTKRLLRIGQPDSNVGQVSKRRSKSRLVHCCCKSRSRVGRFGGNNVIDDLKPW